MSTMNLVIEEGPLCLRVITLADVLSSPLNYEVLNH